VILGNEKGFTITELMVVMLMSSLVAGVVFLTYSYINRNTADWKKKVYQEEALETFVRQMDVEIKRIRVLDSATTQTIYYRDSKEQAKVLALDTVLKTATCGFADGRPVFGLEKGIRLVRGGFTFRCADMSLDKNVDGIVDDKDLDINHNNRIDADEVGKIDFLEYRLNFEYGKIGHVEILGKNRLLSKTGG